MIADDVPAVHLDSNWTSASATTGIPRRLLELAALGARRPDRESRAIASCFSPRIETAKRPVSCSATPVRVSKFSAIMTMGGARLMDPRELIVVPCRSPARSTAVTTETPLSSRPSSDASAGDPDHRRTSETAHAAVSRAASPRR
jgi:hypothetical protein